MALGAKTAGASSASTRPNGSNHWNFAHFVWAHHRDEILTGVDELLGTVAMVLKLKEAFVLSIYSVKFIHLSSAKQIKLIESLIARYLIYIYLFRYIFFKELFEPWGSKRLKKKFESISIVLKLKSKMIFDKI